jgi:hypothetical protein
MKKILLTLLVMLATGLAFGQVKPNEFVEELNPSNSNFEVYSQKGGVNRRASLANLKRYFVPAIGGNIGYVPTPFGNANNRMQVVTDPNGDTWYIDADGAAKKLTDNWGSQKVVRDATLTGGGIAGDTLRWAGAYVSLPVTGTGEAGLPLGILDGGIQAAKLADGSVTAAKINQMGATTGQVIRWTGSAWAPTAPNQYLVVTSSQTVAAQYNQVFVDSLTASITLNLAPCNAANNNVKFEFAKAGGDNYPVHIEPAGLETFIDGSQTKTLFSRGVGFSCTCRWNGTSGKWLFISN